MIRHRNIIALLLAVAISLAAVGAYGLAVTATTPTHAPPRTPQDVTHQYECAQGGQTTSGAHCASLMSIPLPPMMAYSRWPDTSAGYWSYISYKHTYAVGAYECASGLRQSGMLGSNTYTKACVDWYIISKAKAVRARLFHAIDYYKYWNILGTDLKYWESIVALYTAWAKNFTKNAGELLYWSTEIIVCSELTGRVDRLSGGNHWKAGLAAGGCHWAFDNWNPYGSL